MEQIRSQPKGQRGQAMQALMQSMPGYDSYRVSLRLAKCSFALVLHHFRPIVL